MNPTKSRPRFDRHDLCAKYADLEAENARLREVNAALASALRTVVDGTRRWNAAVEAVMGKFPDTGIDLTFADEALALHAKGAPQ